MHYIIMYRWYIVARVWVWQGPCVARRVEERCFGAMHALSYIDVTHTKMMVYYTDVTHTKMMVYYTEVTHTINNGVLHRGNSHYK